MSRRKSDAAPAASAESARGRRSASPGYLSRWPVPGRPEELADHVACVGPLDGAGRWTLRKGSETVSVQVGGPLGIDQHEGRIAAAVAGLGIVMSTRHACRHELADGRLVRLLPEWDAGNVELHAVFAAGRAAKPSAKAFSDYLVRTIPGFVEA